MCNLIDNLNMPTRSHEMILVIELIICLDLMRKEKQKRSYSEYAHIYSNNKYSIWQANFIFNTFYNWHILFIYVCSSHRIWNIYALINVEISLFFFIFLLVIEIWWCNWIFHFYLKKYFIYFFTPVLGFTIWP